MSPNLMKLYGWVLEGIWPNFMGCVFEVWADPRGQGKLSKMRGAKPPLLYRVFPGPRGRPDLKNAPTNQGQIAFRYPAKGTTWHRRLAPCGLPGGSGGPGGMRQFREGPRGGWGWW